MKKSLLIFSVTMFASIFAIAQPAGWSFAKRITVSNTSTALAVNYQLKITINTQTLIAVNQMLSNGEDIRFGKNCTGTTLYNYWIESGINTPTTNIWIKIDTIPANGTRTFFMFHGNGTVTPVSSIPGVFVGPHSATDSVASGGSGGATNSQRGFRFTPTEDLLVTHFGKREPNGTPRAVTLFDFTTQALLTQFTVTGAPAQYNYGALPNPLWLTNGTQYILSLYQGATDGYYFGSSSQIGQHMTYGDMRYCNSCLSTTYPNLILTNFHYGYPDLWYFTKSTITPAPTYTYNLPTTISSIAASNTVVCSASNVSLTASNSTSGLTYSWIPNGAAGASIVVTPTATTIYTLLTTQVGCTLPYVNVTRTITVNPSPIVSVNSGSICQGQTFTITASGASTYTYQGGNNVVTPTSSSTFSVIGTGTNGCISSPVNASITVNSNPSISVNSGSICQGQTFTITASGASTYTYQGGNNVVNPTSSSTFSVTGTGTNGCVSAAVNSTITVNTLPTINAATNNTLLCTGLTASLTASGATTYTWNTNANTAVIAVSPTVTTTYTVNGSNANGCSNFTTITQAVSPCTNIKNVASRASANIIVYPNPSNGLFTIELAKSTSIKITNIVGKIVFEEILTEGKNTINLSNFSNGVYFIKSVIDSNEQVIKLIKE